MKRFIAVLVAAIMVLSMGTVAFAADPVAKIGDAVYGTLEEALAVTEAGTEIVTITLLKDAELNYEVNSGIRKTNAKIVGSSQDVKLTFTGLGTGSIDVSLENLTVVDETCYKAENGENAWEFTYLELTGKNTFKNVIFTDGIMFDAGADIVATDCTFMGHNNDSSEYGNGTMYAVWVHDGSAVFENCVFEGTRGAKIHEKYGSNVVKVEFNNCVFDSLTEKPGIAIGELDKSTEVTVKNCYFFDCQKGDAHEYDVPFMYESDIDVENFVFTNTDNTICADGNHNKTAVAGTGATSNSAGVKNHYKCETCGVLFAENDNTSVTTEEELVIPVIVPEKKPDRDTVTIKIDATGKAGTEAEEEESNPNTGAPVIMPFAVVAAALSGAAIIKRK